MKSMRPSANCLNASTGSLIVPSEADFLSLVLAGEVSCKPVAEVLRQVLFLSVLLSKLVLSVLGHPS